MGILLYPKSVNFVCPVGMADKYLRATSCMVVPYKKACILFNLLQLGKVEIDLANFSSYSLATLLFL